MQAYHLGIVGDSGSGKTSLARQVFRERFPTGDPTLSVWVNHDNTAFNRLPNKPNIQRVRGRASMETAVRENGGAKGLRLNFRTSNQLQAVETTREFFHYVHDYYRGKDADPPKMQVVIDESQNVLPDGDVDDSNPAKKILHEDRDKGIRAILVTQDPQDWAYTPIKQVRKFAWVGSPSTFHKGFLQYFNMQELDLPSEPYHYAVVNPSLPPEVVSRGTTSEDYA